jgi:hypothetical protein
MANQSRSMLEWSECWLVGLRDLGGVGWPHLGASGHFGASLCILTSKDISIHLRFLVVCPWGRRPTPKSVLCRPNLMCNYVWPWTSPWHVHYYPRCPWGSLHLAQCVLYHKNRENVKRKGSAGGNTPAEPTSLIYSTNVRHKLHQVGEAVSLSTPTFVDLTVKTHTKPLRDL